MWELWGKIVVESFCFHWRRDWVKENGEKGEGWDRDEGMFGTEMSFGRSEELNGFWEEKEKRRSNDVGAGI